MNDILIENNATRNEIIKYIMNLLINVNNNIILPYHKNLKSEDISTKTSNDDFVSIADKKSEDFITKQLKGFLDVSDILGEETAFLDKQYHKYLDKPILWVVDPIDGTKNYINGKENFCSMISLVSHKLPIATFIYWPLKNIFVYAFKNYGAFIVDTINNTLTKLSIKPYNLLKIIGSGGTKGIPEIYRQSILNNLKTSTERLFIGSAGIETIMLAKNEIQFIFHGRVTPWDHSPMNLITKEAGGCIYMAINKAKFNIKSKGSILAASNFQIWNNIRDIIIPSNNPYRKYI
jgi:fructose-1,6-bisphosphatase/inositol monophosphatase family enzyme